MKSRACRSRGTIIEGGGLFVALGLGLLLLLLLLDDLGGRARRCLVHEIGATVLLGLFRQA